MHAASAGVVMMAGGALLLWPPDATREAIAIVQRGAFAQTIVTRGTIGAARVMLYGSTIAGAQAKILEIVAEGQAVSAGDVLFRFDAAPFEELVLRETGALAQAEAELGVLAERMEAGVEDLAVDRGVVERCAAEEGRRAGRSEHPLRGGPLAVVHLARAAVEMAPGAGQAHAAGVEPADTVRIHRPHQPSRDRTDAHLQVRRHQSKEAGDVVRSGPGIGVEREDEGRRRPLECCVHAAREPCVFGEADRLERDVCRERRSAPAGGVQAAVGAGAVHDHDLQRPVLQPGDRFETAREVGGRVVGDDADGDAGSAHSRCLQPLSAPAKTRPSPRAASSRDAARCGR
jgi:hypothetical protein